MAEHTYRLTELVGTSDSSVQEAIRNAVSRAGQTLKGMDWFQVQEIRGTIKDGEVDQFQVTMKIGFRVMSPEELAG